MAPIDPSQILQNTFIATVECHESLTSTNDHAIACATQNPRKLPLLVWAARQTAGRGRGANRWWTGPGALAFSLLLPPQQFGRQGPLRSSLLALAAGVAMVETVTPLAPGHTVGLHWPNDVMAEGRKLCGILVEVLADGHHILGIGINTNNTAADAPEELRPLVATLRDLTGRTHDSTQVLVGFLKRLAEQLGRLDSAPEHVAARADAICLQRGRPLTVRQGSQTVAGRCLGIAADGALRLETPEGERRVYSGAVEKS